MVEWAGAGTRGCDARSSPQGSHCIHTRHLSTWRPRLRAHPHLHHPTRATHLRKPKLAMAHPMVAKAATSPRSDLTMSHACLASNSAAEGEKCELFLPRYLAGPAALATR